MFSDAIKIAAKIAALVAGVALIIVIFAAVPLPSIDLSAASHYIDIAYTIGLTYIPGFSWLWIAGVFLLNFEIAYATLRMSLVAIRWVLKVNE